MPRGADIGVRTLGEFLPDGRTQYDPPELTVRPRNVDLEATGVRSGAITANYREGRVGRDVRPRRALRNPVARVARVRERRNRSVGARRRRTHERSTEKRDGGRSGRDPSLE